MAEARTRGRPRSKATQQAILDAAYTVLEKEGYAGAAIERIAAEAKVAKQTIYRWWPGKAHLFMEVLGDRAAKHTTLDDTGTLEGDLSSLLTQTFSAVSGPLRPLMRALAIEVLQSESFATTVLDQFVKRRRANVRELVERAIIRDEVAADFDSDLACDLLYGVLWYRLIFNHGPLDNELAEQISSVVANMQERQ